MVECMVGVKMRQSKSCSYPKFESCSGASRDVRLFVEVCCDIRTTIAVSSEIFCEVAREILMPRTRTCSLKRSRSSESVAVAQSLY